MEQRKEETKVAENAMLLDAESENESHPFVSWLRGRVDRGHSIFSPERAEEIVQSVETQLKLTPEERAEQERQERERGAEERLRYARKQAIAQSGLTYEMLKEYQIGRYKPQTKSQQLMVDGAKEWLLKFPNLEKPLGRAMIGPPGVGKSHTLRGAAGFLLTKKTAVYDVRCYYGLVLDAELRKDVERSENEISMSTAILNCDVLFLDDIFKAVNEDMTRYIRDFYFTLFDQIDAKHKPILWWTANGSSEQIREYFDSLDAGWLLDRLMAAVDCCEVDGPNGRTVVYRGAA
ncbi:MAG: hypothetical protein ABFD54_04390 [Armatimonadota bacterium]